MLDPDGKTRGSCSPGRSRVRDGQVRDACVPFRPGRSIPGIVRAESARRPGGINEIAIRSARTRPERHAFHPPGRGTFEPALERDAESEGILLQPPAGSALFADLGPPDSFVSRLDC